MSSREEMLARIGANKPRLDRPLPVVPHFDAVKPASLVGAFKESLQRMGGTLLGTGADVLDPQHPSEARILVQARLVNAKVVCSVVPEIEGNRDIGAIRRPQELADVDIAIVRASFAVAETGSVLLEDAVLQVNAVAYLAQHLIVLLDPSDIVVNLHQAYRRPEFRKRHYASFHTGPSATADIEGVLIHGAQGVRSLSVVLWKRP